MTELAERFHFAKLLLSQTRYLSELSYELDKNPDSRASEIYCVSMKESGHSVLPAPINQAVFLQMAYVNLVWLSEALNSTE
jgi:kynurenine formamidase